MGHNYGNIILVNKNEVVFHNPLSLKPAIGKGVI